MATIERSLAAPYIDVTAIDPLPGPFVCQSPPLIILCTKTNKMLKADVVSTSIGLLNTRFYYLTKHLL